MPSPSAKECMKKRNFGGYKNLKTQTLKATSNLFPFYNKFSLLMYKYGTNLMSKTWNFRFSKQNDQLKCKRNDSGKKNNNIDASMLTNPSASSFLSQKICLMLQSM